MTILSEGYVIKLTGSLFEKGSSQVLVNFANILRNYADRYRFAVVCGGGNTLRYWLDVLRSKSSVSEYSLDLLGIGFTRLNARILINLLYPNVYGQIPESIESALEAIYTTNKIVVLGGLSPGFSTNAVASFISRETGFSLINVTRAGGVYNKDPSQYKDSKKLKEIHIDDLIKILSREAEAAGNYPLFDMTSLNIIKKYRIPTYVISTNISDLEAILNGGSAGTRILFT
ncbi:TPA: UMP kinase [Candidatus Geothermarchaeota archaeon]|nr:UMP kinase [Candidatus Geothermarchaeota archaeon]HIQ12793.1 UMP kinase [Thermoprotei archaeon]